VLLSAALSILGTLTTALTQIWPWQSQETAAVIVRVRQLFLVHAIVADKPKGVDLGIKQFAPGISPVVESVTITSCGSPDN
jgi:hypothetical protein